jgi:hypothetical protein
LRTILKAVHDAKARLVVDRVHALDALADVAGAAGCRRELGENALREDNDRTHRYGASLELPGVIVGAISSRFR